MWSRTRAFACLVIAIMMAGCGSSGPPVFHTEQDYTAAADDVQKLTQTSFQKFDSGQELSEKENQDIRKAIELLEGMVGFHPELYNSYFLEGKAYYTLGQYDQALAQLDQAVRTPLLAGYDKQRYLDTLAEAHYLASLSFFHKHDYHRASNEAQLAAEAHPQSADYLTAEAAAELQLKNEKTAKALLARALYVDPKNRRALQLAKLFH